LLKGIVICADLPPILEKHSQLRRREREREVLKGREREITPQSLFGKEQKLPPNRRIATTTNLLYAYS
jgi:hypothetical protein